MDPDCAWRHRIVFMWDFVNWCVETDRLCRKHLTCSWAVLTAEPEPPVAAFNARETPSQLVVRYRDKYDPEWLTPLEADRVS